MLLVTVLPKVLLRFCFIFLWGAVSVAMRLKKEIIIIMKRSENKAILMYPTAKREWDCDTKISVPATFPPGCGVVWAVQLPLCPVELASSCGSCWWPILEYIFILIPRAGGDTRGVTAGAVALPAHRKAACLLNLAFPYCDCKLY